MRFFMRIARQDISITGPALSTAKIGPCASAGGASMHRWWRGAGYCRRGCRASQDRPAGPRRPAMAAELPAVLNLFLSGEVKNLMYTNQRHFIYNIYSSGRGREERR